MTHRTTVAPVATVAPIQEEIPANKRHDSDDIGDSSNECRDRVITARGDTDTSFTAPENDDAEPTVIADYRRRKGQT
jgi:hypothetical protein